MADRINLLLAEKAFTFSPMELSRIHGFLFKGVLPHAGQFRTYNVTKNQWILDGETIIYGSADSLSELLNYDFGEEDNLIIAPFLLRTLSDISCDSFQASGRFTLLAKVIHAQLPYFLSNISEVSASR